MTRHANRVVLAAVDGPDVAGAVRDVATSAAERLALPWRSVHVVPGTGPRGPAREAALQRVWRDEADEIVGRPADVIAAMANAPEAVLTVIGAPGVATVSGSRRDGGTAFAVARRARRPLLLAPPTAVGWKGPRHVLVPLDGTAATAMAAARGLEVLGPTDAVVTTLRVVDPEESDRPGADGGAGGGAGGGGGERELVRTGRVSACTLGAVEDVGADLVVLVWKQRTVGGHATAVTEIVAGCGVPVLLVPATAA